MCCRARARAMPERLGVAAGSYVLATLHRPSNVDDAERLALILEALATSAEDGPVVFPMHPRTLALTRDGALRPLLEKLIVTEPLGYAEMAGLLDGAARVLADNGGLPEVTRVLGAP